ncbi:hypothetical protein ACM7Q1_11500 [Paenibacillus illinoisensis]
MMSKVSCGPRQICVIEINDIISKKLGMNLIFNAGRMKSYDDIGTPT